LGKDSIIFDGQYYSFNRELDYEYDTENYWGALERAHNAANPQDQRGAYKAAVQLYQGEYLPEINGTWVHPEREKLRQTYLQTCLELCRLYLKAEEHERALSLARRLTSEDPCLEEAHRLSMRAHAALGNRAAINQQYQFLKKSLFEELDISPSAHTESLYQSLIR